MITNEKIEDLSAEDLRKIKNNTKTMILVLVLVSFFFSFLGYIIYKQISHSTSFWGALFGLIPFGILVYVYISSLRDIKDGRKRILTGTITKKYERTSRSSSKSGSSSTSYYIEIGNEDFTLNWKEYHSVHEGELVEIQLTMISKTVLHIRTLQANTSHTPESNRLRSSEQRSAPQFVRMADLDEQEHLRLRSIKNKALLRFVIFYGIAGYLLSYLLKIIFIIVVYFAKIKLPKDVVGHVFTFAIPGLILLFIAWRFNARLRVKFVELRSREKKIVETVIEDKISSNVMLLQGNWKVTTSRGDFRYFVIDGKKYRVNPQQYALFEGGELIFAHFTPETNLLLRIESKVDKGRFIVF